MKRLLFSIVVLAFFMNLMGAVKVVGDRLENEEFGYSAALNQTWGVIGAKFSGTQVPYLGAIYIYKRTSNDWNCDWLRYAKIKPSNGKNFGHFGYDVAISTNNEIIVGSDYAAQAHIFSLDGDVWGNQITLSNPTTNNMFGRAVSIDNDVAVVGARYHVPANFAGTAYVFEKNFGGAGNWGRRIQLTASDPAGQAYFGKAVSVDDNTIIVGAHGASKVYVFERDFGGVNNWGQSQLISVPGTGLGYSVSVDGNFMAISAMGERAVYIFHRALGVWQQVDKIDGLDNAKAVSLDYPYVAIGGRPEEWQQKVYLYKADVLDNAGEWTLVEELSPFSGRAAYGSDVAVYGNQVLVSDSQSEEWNQNNGSEGTAYFYDTNHDYDGNPWGQFTIINFEAGNQLADFMFSNAGNPYSLNNFDPYNTYAYETLQWSDLEGSGHHVTESRLNQSGSELLDGLLSDNIDFRMDGFALSGFNKINSANLGLPWDDFATPGAADNRYYDGGNGQITYNGEVKLQWENMYFNLTVPYPFQQAITHARVGTGGSITGYGQADLIVANCDPAWLAEFDPDGSGQMMFDIESFSPAQQGEWGYYTAEITITPIEVIRTYDREDVGTEGNNIDLSIHFDGEGIDFDFNSIEFGEGDGNDLIVSYINDQIEAPELGELTLGDNYWHFGTTFNSFNTDVTFDLDRLGNIASNQGVRIYRRVALGGDWERWNDIQLIGQTQVRALNVNGFSDWLIASENQPLPVTLSSFTAVQTSNSLAQINWVTHSESNLIGYNLYRNTENSTDGATIINSQIIAASNTTTEHSYSFTDNSIELNTKYYYWLESLGVDGSSQFFGPVQVNITDDDITPEIPMITSLSSNYPNPFNPTTAIKLSIKDGEKGKLTIYNMKGQVILSKTFEAGNHIYNWQADKYTSGVYFYRLQTDNYSKIKKMILLK